LIGRQFAASGAFIRIVQLSWIDSCPRWNLFRPRRSRFGEESIPNHSLKPAAA
jgi:hypothetical protein